MSTQHPSKRHSRRARVAGLVSILAVAGLLSTGVGSAGATVESSQVPLASASVTTPGPGVFPNGMRWQ